jgi:hypothetical protein
MGDEERMYSENKIIDWFWHSLSFISTVLGGAVIG